MTELKSTLDIKIDRNTHVTFSMTQFLDGDEPTGVAEQSMTTGALMKLVASAFAQGYDAVGGPR